MKRVVALATLIGLSCLARSGMAAVVLNGSAPTAATDIFNSYPSTAPLTVTNYSDYLVMGTFARGDASVNPVRPTGSAFGSQINLLTAVTPTSPTTNNYQFRYSSQTVGPYFTRPGSTNFQGWAFNQAEAYNATTGAIDGLSLTYTLAANTTATLNYYIGSFNGLFEYSLTADGQATPIATLTTPTGQTGGFNTTGTAGSGNNLGVLSFNVTNQDASPTVLTFKLLYAGAVGSSPAVGLQGATAVVPEPAMLGVIGAGAIALLRRRKSTLTA